MNDDGKDVALAHTPGYDLRVLRAEIQDDDFFWHAKAKIFPGAALQGERKMVFLAAKLG